MATTMSRPKRPTPAQAKQAVEKWNATNPTGTAVRYWKGVRDGAPSGEGPTRSEAFMDGSGTTAVVFVEGCSGYVALSHVERVD